MLTSSNIHRYKYLSHFVSACWNLYQLGSLTIPPMIGRINEVTPRQAQLVLAWVTGKPPRCVTSHPVQLSLLSPLGQEIVPAKVR